MVCTDVPKGEPEVSVVLETARVRGECGVWGLLGGPEEVVDLVELVLVEGGVD